MRLNLPAGLISVAIAWVAAAAQAPHAVAAGAGTPFSAAAADNAPPPAGAAGAKVLASFKDPDSAKEWTAVNDGVMGGLSQGGCRRTEAGTLLFSGKLSLENNGGFSSIRSKPRPLDLSGSSAIAVKAMGDGRTYWVELRVSGQMRASSYRAYLPTVAGQWKEAVIPVGDFKLQAFGREIPSPPVKLSQVESVGLTLADKQAGPFTLELESVAALAADDPRAAPRAAGTLLEVAREAGGFKTLLAAADAADLAGALSGDGPLTLFAPTDEAFAKLPKGTLEELLKPANRARLAAILRSHVVPGRVTLGKALETGGAPSLQGARIGVGFADGRVRVGAATLEKADIPASNGVIHVIDAVLTPPAADGRPPDAAALIGLAVERGVPLFNDGNPAACAAVYEIACEALRSMPEVPEKSRAELARALDEMRAEKDGRRQAWILRKAIDSVFAGLGKDGAAGAKR